VMSERRGSVGMPAYVLLHEFGSLVLDAFGNDDHFGIYQVGSSLTSKTWRDVDVRLMLSDEAYQRYELGDPNHPHMNARWWALVRAFACMGREMTGLPIDFQIQEQTYANLKFPSPEHGRNALGMVPWRFKQPAA